LRKEDISELLHRVANPWLLRKIRQLEIQRKNVSMPTKRDPQFPLTSVTRISKPESLGNGETASYYGNIADLDFLSGLNGFRENTSIITLVPIPRSCQQGDSTEAAHQGVGMEVIELICRWRKVADTKFGNVGTLHGSFTGVGNLLVVSPAALSQALSFGCHCRTGAVGCFE
jgi:hypothetical protein